MSRISNRAGSISLIQFFLGLAIALGGLIIGVQVAIAEPANEEAWPFFAISALGFVAVGVAMIIRRNAQPFNLKEAKGWWGVAGLFLVIGIAILAQFNG